MKDRRPGNYNKQEYYYLDDSDEIKAIFSEWKDLKEISVFPRFFDFGFSCEFDFYLILDEKQKDKRYLFSEINSPPSSSVQN